MRIKSLISNMSDILIGVFIVVAAALLLAVALYMRELMIFLIYFIPGLALL